MQNVFTMKFFLFFAILVMVGGCSTQTITFSAPKLPLKSGERIAVFALENYTQTPQAGKRAANLIGSRLAAGGFTVVNMIDGEAADDNARRELARKSDAAYYLDGGVSEWQYKTGIDGEPAVSLTLRLHDGVSGDTLWSVSGSRSEWGNGSIGNTAQLLINELLR
ncbi:MAG: penicillin-binding protein activator LpoB [Campylobacterales bacterium]|nr:penicillin-binding protein activator LpoB [Campylobacterales bacterium]